MLLCQKTYLWKSKLFRMKKIMFFLFILFFGYSFIGAQDTVQDRDFWLARYMSVSMPLKSVKIVSTYGYRKDPFTKKRSSHNGLDLQARYENVYSMLDGVVESVGSDKRSGNYIVVRSGNYTLSYCHLSRKYINEGDSVNAGETIAVSGNTGRSTGPHLHLTFRKGGELLDPHLLLLYVKKVRKECLNALGGSTQAYEPVSCSDFLSQYAAMAMVHQKRYGIPASVTLAQMALESSWGTSALALNGNNYFGIKATKKWIADGKPYSLHDDEKRNEKFCNYTTVEESMEHHSKLLTSSHYKRYCSHSPTDYHNWLVGLIRGGYASGKGYVATCEKIIRQYKLYLYDKVAAEGT